MTQATIHEAKTQLSRLIRKALDGEEVIIANRDKPLVRLQAVRGARPSPRIGGLRHWRKKTGARDFDDPRLNEEIVREFHRRARTDPLFDK